MSRILKEIHESVTRGYDNGIIDIKTMQKYDRLCMMNSHVMKPEEIQNIRKNIVTIVYRRINLG